MAVQYIKYQMPFADVDGNKYRVNIFGSIPSGTAPDPIILQAGDTPLEIDEDDSDDFYEPIRTQTGNIGICTRMPDGTSLDLEAMLPSSNISTPVQVQKYVSSAWTTIWMGYLSCEMYNQEYKTLPENISLPIISLLEALKSVYINANKVETVGELLVEAVTRTPGHAFQTFAVPQDYAIFEKIINTSIFVEKKEYQNEENTLYELQGSSAYDILSTLCTFMGWTAREAGSTLYLEVMQGYGQIEGTLTLNMSSLTWRGTDHQRSIRQGRRIGTVTAKLADFDIKTELGDIPFGSFDYEKYQQIGTGGWWVYFLPSSNTGAYNNMSLRFYAGSLRMGIQYDQQNTYDFSHLSDSVDVSDMIENSIPYADGYPALGHPVDHHTIYAGACFSRMQFDEYNDPDVQHQNTQDGLLISLFPGAYDSQNRPTQHIFEMRAVQNFAAIEDGYINISTALKLFAASPWVGVLQTDNKLVMDIQVGDKIWNGSAWVNATGNNAKFLAEFDTDGTKFKGNWNDQMDIDEVPGYLIPTFYTEGGVKKHVMGPLTMRIYPETYIPNLLSAQRSTFICNIFFSDLSMDYIPKRSVKLADRSENTYRKTINTNFAEDVEVSTDLASWLHNNPSPSLLYNADGQTPMQTLPYLKADGVNTKNQRPEINLLERMQAFYGQPRTILSLEVEHPSTPLPLLRLNGLGDGKVYAPISESRDFRNNVSTITCMEIPS